MAEEHNQKKTLPAPPAPRGRRRKPTPEPWIPPRGRDQDAWIPPRGRTGKPKPGTQEG